MLGDPIDLIDHLDGTLPHPQVALRPIGFTLIHRHDTYQKIDSDIR